MKKQLIMLSALMFGIGAGAKTISPDEALSRVSAEGPAKVRAMSGLKLAHTATTKEGKPAAYVYNCAGEKGYMVLSADDLAYPVLGYAESGSFDAEAMSPAMKWWIEEYGRQIEYASANENLVKPAMKKMNAAGRSAIAPMVKTKWDQGEPYWNKCPIMSGNPTWTGCVATSMAQVMNYWQYPERGQGSISYNSESLDKRLTLDFSRQPKFDWENMLETYREGEYTEAEAEAVARLMVCAGYSVKMDYSADSSGALAMNISKALVKYFNYDAGIDYQLRHMHSTSEWEALIYEGLKTGPVLYGGDSFLGGGHSFICDGYDGEGYFHFNWGWSGMSDGYFLLDALTPGALGAGGGSGGGYSFTQDAVLNIQPDRGTAAEEKPLTVVQMGSVKAGLSGNQYLYFDLTGQGSSMWVNYNPETLKVEFGARFTKAAAEGEEAGEPAIFPINEGKCFELGPGYGTNPYYIKEVGDVDSRVELATAGLEEGSYKVVMMMRHEGEEEWLEIPAAYGYSNFFSLTRTGDTYKVENDPVKDLKIVDGGLEGTTYYNCLARPWITVRNDSDIELNKGFAPVLLWKEEESGEYYIFLLGESVMISLAPGEKVTKEWTTDLYLMQNVSELPGTDYVLTWFDESTYNFYDSQFRQNVTILPNPGMVKLTAPNGIRVEDREIVNERVNGVKHDVYLIDDPLDIPVRCELKIADDSASEVYDYTTYAAVTMAGDTSYEILAMAGQPMQFDMEAGEVSFATDLQMPTALADKYYMIAVCYLYGTYFMPAYDVTGKYTTYGYFRLKKQGEASVEGIITDSGLNPDAPIYNMHGVYMGSNPSALQPGLYIKNGKKILVGR